VGVGLIFGVAFEAWEALEGVGGGYGGYWFDTIKDIFDDALGAFMAWIIYVGLKLFI
jgi:hypothetical protein